MKVQVDWLAADDNLRVDHYDSPHTSARIFHGGRGMVLLRDEQWEITGGAQYARVSRICWGSALVTRPREDQK